MTELLKLELIAPELDATEVAQLTEELHETLRQSEQFRVERSEQGSATPGAKPIVEYIAGQLVIALASQVAKPAIDDIKQAIGAIVHDWLLSVRAALTVRVRDDHDTVEELRSPAAHQPHVDDLRRSGNGSSPPLPPSPPSLELQRDAGGALSADDPGAAQQVDASAATASTTKHYALLIGNQTFDAMSGIPPLQCANNEWRQ